MIVKSIAIKSIGLGNGQQPQEFIDNVNRLSVAKLIVLIVAQSVGLGNLKIWSKIA